MRTTGSATVDPSETEPNDRFDGLVVKPRLFTPVPALVICSTGVDEVSDKVICSPIQPLTAGLNVIESGMVSPGPMATGRFTPDTLNSAPLTLTDETVMLAVPGFVTSTTWLSELPTATLPKRRREDDGDNACWPASDGTAAPRKNVRAKTERNVVLDWGSFIGSV